MRETGINNLNGKIALLYSIFFLLSAFLWKFSTNGTMSQSAVIV